MSATPPLTRWSVPRPLVKKFFRELVEQRLLSQEEADEDLARWEIGARFRRGYRLLDGFVCRYGQDAALAPQEIDQIREHIFESEAS